MLNQLRVLILSHTWVRRITGICVLILGIIFAWLSGGIPPQAWRFLFQVMQQFSRLWMVRGPMMLIPFVGLLLLCLLLLMIWIVLLFCLAWILWQEWLDIRIHQFMNAEPDSEEQQTGLPQPWQRQPTPEQLFAMEETLSEFSLSPDPLSAPAIPFTPRPASPITRPVQVQQPLQPARPLSQPLPARNAARPAAPIPVTPPTAPPIRPVSSVPASSPLSRPSSPSSPLPSMGSLQRLHRPTAVLQAVQAEREAANGHNGHNGYQSKPGPPVPGSTATASKSNSDPGTLQLVTGTGLHTGLTRKQKPNEDSVLAIEGMRTCDTGLEPYGLFVVADGVGGHANGQVASRLTIQSMRDIILPTLLSNHTLQIGEIRELLHDAVHHANLAVYKHNHEHESDMGSTVTAAIVTGAGIVVANIGDSRTYLYTNQKGLTRVTKDHSAVERLVEIGEITPDEVYTHPKRNEIYRCVGDKVAVQIDTFMLPPHPGTTLILCSDGVWEMIRDPQIALILRNTLPDASKASRLLVEAALTGGGKDNISVIVVHII